MTKDINKLVRDNIPNLIIIEGRCPQFRQLSDSEYKSALVDKLQEEVKEYVESQNLEELADIMEVVYAILDAEGLKMQDLELVRQNKAKTNGRFEKRYFLESITSIIE